MCSFLLGGNGQDLADVDDIRIGELVGLGQLGVERAGAVELVGDIPQAVARDDGVGIALGHGGIAAGDDLFAFVRRDIGSSGLDGDAALRGGILLADHTAEIIDDVVDEDLVVDHHAVLEELDVLGAEHGVAVAGILEHVVMGGEGVGLVDVEGLTADHDVRHTVRAVDLDELGLIVLHHGAGNVRIDGVGQAGNLQEAAALAGIGRGAELQSVLDLLTGDLNEACLVEVTGQQIKDALELGSAAYPGESGGFLQVSGLTYTINADIPSSVVKNDKSEFVKVDGAYRVSDIMVGGQPLDVNKTYTLASHNYMLKDAGDGYTMFGTKNVKLLKDGVMIDNQVLINYIVNNLGGVVGEQYAAPQGRITIKTAASDVPTNESEKVIAGRNTTVTEGDTYTVVAGDCLWNIAYKLYGTGTLYTKLAEANKLADPYIIYIGQILTVPAK